jgi:hypothetical protein
MSQLVIKYRGSAFVLVPGQTIEIERNNPMFMFDSNTGEYSSQIAMMAIEENRAIIGNDLFLELSAKKKIKLEVEVFDGDTFSYYATLVLQSNFVDRIFENRGKLNGVLLFAFSKFFNKIKNKKATELYLGGEVTKNYTTSDVTDSTNGYWQHFHQTRNNTENYLVAPIINDVPSDVNLAINAFLNPLDDNNNLAAYFAVNIFPRVKFVLEQILLENGWGVDTSLLTGTGWENLFYISFKSFTFLDVSWTETWLGSSYDNVPSFTPKSSITFRIADTFSKEITVQDLFFETCKHYGWIPLFDSNKNVCKFFPLRNCKLIDRTDFTNYAAKEFTTDFSADTKKVSFKNTFGGNDTLPSAPSFENLKKEAAVLNVSDLPSPLGNYDSSIIYVSNENKWYKVDLDATTNQRIWVVFADNIYDEIATNETESIDTKITTLPVYKTKLRTSSGTDYYGYVAWAKQDVDKAWGLRILYYHGLVKEILNDGSDGLLEYPYLSSICVIPNKTIAADWSNVFTHNIGGVDYGIIKYWFKDWIDLTNSIEQTEQQIWLPYYEMRKLKFDCQILLFNKIHLMKSYIEPLPYKGFIVAKLLSLLKVTSEIAVANGVFAKLVWEDEQDGADIYIYGVLLSDHVRKSKPVVYIYADAGGSIPLSVVNLNIKLKARAAAESSGVATAFSAYADYHFSLSGVSKEFCNTTLHCDTSGYLDIVPTSISPYFVIKQHFTTSPSTDFLLNDFILDTSSDYTIIP